MAQLHIHITDLIPTETKAFCEALPKYQEWKADIKKNGIRVALKVHPNGTIGNGNARYWIAKALGLKWLPVDARYYLGIWIHEGILFLRKDWKLDDEIMEDVEVEPINGNYYPEDKVVNDGQCWAIKNPRRIRIFP